MGLALSGCSEMILHNKVFPVCGGPTTQIFMLSIDATTTGARRTTASPIPSRGESGVHGCVNEIQINQINLFFTIICTRHNREVRTHASMGRLSAASREVSHPNSRKASGYAATNPKLTVKALYDLQISLFSRSLSR